MSNIFLKLISLLALLIAFTRGQTVDCSSFEALNTIHSCLGCNYLWELSLNKCINTCQTSTYYNRISMKCESCPEKCEQCIDGNSCQKCFGSLKYNLEQQKCVCNIEGCLQCDFKGDICRLCQNGYEQDIGLKCVKSQPKLIIQPRQGMSLQTLFSFSLQDEYNKDQSGDLQQYKSYKCTIIGNNMSTQSNISISTSSCNFNQYLPTLNNLEVYIFEYTTISSTGQTEQTNQFVYKENISVVSSFSSLNNLWQYIQSQIKPIDSLQLQILTLYEYSHLIKNNCQLGNYCLNSGNICYTPMNYCICGSGSYSGMRDCSSMKISETQFNQYLNNVYNMCVKSIKGINHNITCPQPITDETPNGDKNYILFLLEQSYFFNDDNDFILALRNSLTKINDSYILKKMFPYIIQRLVSKYNKIFSKVDSENNLLIIYKVLDNFQIDYSVFSQGQIPINFFQHMVDIENNQSSNQESFQQLVFSDQMQQVQNKYTVQYQQQFNYIKLMNQQKILLTYSFENKNEFDNSQMICLQANQQNTNQIQQPLILCNQIEYDPNQNALNCKCQGDTFLFLNDNKNLYLTNEEYELLISKDIPQTKRFDSSINQDYKLLIVIFVCGLFSIGIFIGFYLYIRKQKQQKQIKQTKINQTNIPVKKTISIYKINKSPETNNISLKQCDFTQKNDQDEIFSIHEEDEHKRHNIFFNKNESIQNDDDLKYQAKHMPKQTLVTQKTQSKEIQDLIQKPRQPIKHLQHLSLKGQQIDKFGNCSVRVLPIKSIYMNNEQQQNSQCKIDEICEVDQDHFINISKHLTKNESKAEETTIIKRTEVDISMQTPDIRAIMHSPLMDAQIQNSPDTYQLNNNQNGSPESKLVLLLDQFKQGKFFDDNKHKDDKEKIKQRRMQKKNQPIQQENEPSVTEVNKVNKLLFQDSQN